MKKSVLIGTSALALSTAFATLSVSQVHAAEFEMHIGGFFESRIAYSSVKLNDDPATYEIDPDGEYDGVDVKRDSEIHFKPSATLDNGIRIGANIQLEGADQSDQIDEAYLFIDGAFGRVLLGSENSARYLMHYAAPTAGSFEVNHGDIRDHIPYEDIRNHGDDTLRGTLGSSFVENNRFSDAERITYFTPRIPSGFQFGVSYARDRREDDTRQEDISSTRNSNFFDFGLNHVSEIGDIDLAAAVGYGIALQIQDDDVTTVEVDESDKPQVWNVGVNVSWQGWTLGGSFAEQNSTGANDGTFFDGGIMYETGPWGFSFAYAHGENQDDEEPFEGTDEILDQFVIGLDYDLARGVKLNGYAAYVVFEEDPDQSGEFSALDGFVIGTGLRIDF